jgi:hypothetical protein
MTAPGEISKRKEFGTTCLSPFWSGSFRSELTTNNIYNEVHAQVTVYM